LRKSELVKTVVSEEQPYLVKLSDDGMFNISLDPLDGSSNIESNNLVGTIIGIYKKDLPSQGKHQIAAMYVLYGPVTTLVYTAQNGVHEFLYTKQGVVLREQNMTLPEPGKLYGIGGLRKDWLPAFKQYIEQLETEGYKLRYDGSFVGDFNQILHYGGIFAYPALITKPEGKLRLLVESNTMSFIAKHAGGNFGPIPGNKMFGALYNTEGIIMAANTRIVHGVAKGVFRAAKDLRAAVIFEFAKSESDLKGGYTGLTPQDFSNAVCGIANEVGFGTWALHADHITVKKGTEEELKGVKELIEAQIAAGYTSFVIDASFLFDLAGTTALEELQRNINVTTEPYTMSRGISLNRFQ
jgi:hypothetical protein